MSRDSGNKTQEEQEQERLTSNQRRCGSQAERSDPDPSEAGSQQLGHDFRRTAASIPFTHRHSLLCIRKSFTHTQTHTLAAIATDGRGETVKIEAPVIAVEIRNQI